MPRRSSTKDETQIAFSVLGEMERRDEERDKTNGNGHAKNPAAVALGRLGGMKGGKARAEKLSTERKTEIALKAARARWARKAAK